MSLEAQTGILCYELIHGWRRDWMVTILEEVYASLLWFHPAIWWLLSQTRLVREQLVDAEVVIEGNETRRNDTLRVKRLDC